MDFLKEEILNYAKEFTSNENNTLKELERETGVATGLKQNGSLTIATSEDRLEELKDRQHLLKDLISKLTKLV